MTEASPPTPDEPTPDAQPRRVGPYLIVAGIAVAVFVVALVVFRGGDSTSSDAAGDGSGAGCGQAAPNPGYSVAVASDPDPPRVEGTNFKLTVRHDGRAVTGAKVCITADMTGMRHEGIKNTAKEASGGVYDVTLAFGMRGPYAASVIISEPGQPAVSVPLNFQVE